MELNKKINSYATSLEITNQDVKILLDELIEKTSAGLKTIINERCTDLVVQSLWSLQRIEYICLNL